MKALSHAPKILLTAALLASMLSACKRNDITTPVAPGTTTTSPANTSGTSGTTGATGTGTDTTGTTGTTGTTATPDATTPPNNTTTYPERDRR